MSLEGNAVLCGFSVTLLATMFFYTARQRDGRSLAGRLHLWMHMATMALLIADLFSRMDGLRYAFYPALNRAGNFLLFALSPVHACLWFLYVLAQARGGECRVRRALCWLLALNAANVAVTVATLFTGWYYTIGPGNVYARGPYFPVSTGFLLMPALATYVLLLRGKKRFDRRSYYPLLLFPLPPVAGVLLQALVYGVPFALHAMVLSLLIVTLYVQERDMFTDSLTGVGNRRQLMAVVADKIRRSSEGRTFSLLMLDIDNFKVVNDTMGHDVGDRLLVAAAEMLRACVRARDYVVRYGGDEFILIIDIDHEEELRALVERIEARTRALNEAEELPSRLSFSIGEVVYRCGASQQPDQLIRLADQRMYADKKRRRAEQ